MKSTTSTLSKKRAESVAVFQHFSVPHSVRREGGKTRIHVKIYHKAICYILQNIQRAAALGSSLSPSLHALIVRLSA
jgi:O-phosphoseryl-tRNA(Cys) synthetase